MSVLSNLKLIYKFLLVFVVVLIPTVLFAGLYFGNQKEDISFSAKEISGVDYLVPAHEVLVQVSKYTALVNARAVATTAAEKSLFSQKASSQEAAVNNAIAQVDAVEANQDGLLGLTSNWSSLKSQWSSVRSSGQADAGERLADDMTTFLVKVGDASNLVLDPELASFYLMEAVVIKLPELYNEIEAVRNLLRKQSAAGSDRVEALIHIDRAQQKLNSARQSLETAFANNPDGQAQLAPLLRSLESGISSYVAFSKSELNGSSINISAVDGQADGVEAALQSLYMATAPELKKLLQARVDGLSSNMYMNAVLVTVCLIVAMALALLISRSITAPISQAVQVFKRIQNGDLSSQVKVTGKDETGQLLQSLSDMQVHLGVIDEVAGMLEGMSAGDLTRRVTTKYNGKFEELKDDANKLADTFSGVVGNIQETTSAVKVAANEISEGNKNLSNRTENQAASLEQTAASMEEITSTIKQNTENAREADQLSTVARDTAEEGGKVVDRAIDAMNTINESSTKIADIISVIDEIAFQTNLLALNASVEAARAGEQGRGFAVVAGEVRNLAGRSATAAKEIKELIEDSVGKVNEGSELVNHSGETLKEIVASVAKVSNIVSEITAASEEQSLGIEEMNRAITQIDEVTQQNTALVEEVAAASESTGDQATDLERQMMFFNIGRGGSSTAGRPPVMPKSAAVSERPAAASIPGPAASAPATNVTPIKTASGDDEFWEEF